MTKYQLQKLYRDNGVKWRNTQTVYRQHYVRRHQLDYERVLFIQQILRVIIRGEPHGYFDEMALHGFLTIKRAWSYEETPVCCPMNGGKRVKCTVYGTISNVLSRPCLMYREKSTNADDCLAYLQMLRAEVAKVTDQKLHLILDNHPAHKAARYTSVKQYLDEHFITHWMPPSTPQVNSIETFWAVFKQRFRKLLMLNPETPLSQGQFEYKVEAVGAQFTQQEALNLMRANHGYMHQMLRDHRLE